jgi:hypothetical protein
MRKGRISSIGGPIQKFVVFATVLMLIVGCSNSASSSKDSDGNVKTIQTYLEKEFTGPNDELRKVLEQDDPYPPELEAYLEENYKPLVADLEDVVNANYALAFLRFAYGNGYQLQPTNIDIQKIKNTQNNAYNYEVKVEYSKDGETNTATITGRVNLNDNGKISTIRNMDDDGLLEKMRK